MKPAWAPCYHTSRHTIDPSIPIQQSTGARLHFIPVFDSPHSNPPQHLTCHSKELIFLLKWHSLCSWITIALEKWEWVKLACSCGSVLCVCVCVCVKEREKWLISLFAHVCVCVCLTYIFAVCILCVLGWQVKSRAVTGPAFKIDRPTGSRTRDGFASTNWTVRALELSKGARLSTTFT